MSVVAVKVRRGRRGEQKTLESVPADCGFADLQALVAGAAGSFRTLVLADGGKEVASDEGWRAAAEAAARFTTVGDGYRRCVSLLADPDVAEGEDRRLAGLVAAGDDGLSELLGLAASGDVQLGATDERGRSAAHLYTLLGDAASLRRSLAAGFAAAATDSDGLSPLHYAAAAGDADCCRALLQAGASADQPALATVRSRLCVAVTEGQTPLHCAASARSVVCSQLLLNAGARCVEDAGGELPDLAGVGLAAEPAAVPGGQALFRSEVEWREVREASGEVVVLSDDALAITPGAAPVQRCKRSDWRRRVRQSRAATMQAFQHACGRLEEGDVDALKRWVEAGVALNSPLDGAAVPPLHAAVVCGDEAAAAALLRVGADADSRDAHGLTALHHAAAMSGGDDWASCAEMLLSNGADPAAATVESSVGGASQQLPPFLLVGGRTALHLAAEQGSVSLCSALVRRGADVAAADANGATAGDCARHCGAFRTADPAALLAALGLSADLPSAEERSLWQRSQEAAARSRHGEAAQRSAELRRQAGLRYISQRYRPLHPAVPTGAVLEDRQLSLDRRLAGALESAQMADFVKEHGVNPLPGVWHIPFLSESAAAMLAEELAHLREAAAQPSFPLPVRHDGNVTVTDLGWEPLVARVLAVLQPVLGEIPGMPASVREQPGQPYAFVTRNWATRDENAHFKRHRDQSRVTFNICLSKSPDLAGSTVAFWRAGAAESDPADRQLEHRVGWGWLHMGIADVPEGFATEHQTQAGVVAARGGLNTGRPRCLAGSRCNLIVWGK